MHSGEPKAHDVCAPDLWLFMSRREEAVSGGEVSNSFLCYSMLVGGSVGCMVYETTST